MSSRFAEHCWSLPAPMPSVPPPPVVPASSRGMVTCSSPASSFCPGAEEATQVFLSGHATMSGPKGASGFSCSCLQSRQMMLPRASGVVYVAGKQVPGNFGVAQAENQVKSLFLYSSCSSAKKECTYSAILLCFTFPNLVITSLASLAFELLLLN